MNLDQPTKPNIHTNKARKKKENRRRREKHDRITSSASLRNYVFFFSSFSSSSYGGDVYTSIQHGAMCTHTQHNIGRYNQTITPYSPPLLFPSLVSSSPYSEILNIMQQTCAFTPICDLIFLLQYTT
jgi:hypothetical protein